MKPTAKYWKWIYPLLLLCIAVGFIHQQYNLFSEQLDYYDDALFHLKRFEYLHQQIQNGRWFNGMYEAPYLQGFMYPLGIFYPQLFLYPFVVLTLILDLPIIIGFKIMLAITMTLIAWSSYIALGRLYEKNSFYQFFGTLAFLFTPIFGVLFESYGVKLFAYRIALGEIFAYIFIPWVLVGLRSWVNDHKISTLVIALTGILYSHILTGYLMVICILVFVFLKRNTIFKNTIIIKDGLKIIAWFLGLGAFQMLPMIDFMSTQKYMAGSRIIAKVSMSFGTYSPFFIPFNTTGKIIASILMLILARYLWRKKKPELTFLVLGTLIMSNWFPWGLLDNVSLVTIFQFPFRWAFIFSLAAGSYVMTLPKKKTGYTLLILILIVGQTFWGFFTGMIIAERVPHSITSEDVPHLTDIGGGAEYLPRDTVMHESWPPGMWVMNYHLRDTLISLQEYAESSDTVFPVFYNRGITVLQNGKPVPIKNGYSGLATLVKPMDKSTLTVTYKEPPTRYLGFFISISTLFLFLYKKRKNQL